MKYKLTNNTKIWLGKTLYQIEATASFGNISKGELGGWIEKESNLDQSGDAWVSGDARVSGNARVSGDARVYGNAWVYGNAQVYGNARVYGKLQLSLGYFFGMRFGKEEIKYHKIGEDNELIYKGEAKIDEGDGKEKQKIVMLRKADELIEEAGRLKSEAEKL